MCNYLNLNLLKWKKKFIEFKTYKQNKQYSKLIFELNKLKKEIIDWSKNNKITTKKGLLITDILLTKINKKINKLKINFDHIFNSVFFDNKNDIFELFTLYQSIQTGVSLDQVGKESKQNSNEEFIKLLIKIFKLSINKVIQDVLLPLVIDYLPEIKSNMLTLQNKNETKIKISHFKNVHLNDKQFMGMLPMLLNKLMSIGKIFNTYIQYENKNKFSNKKFIYKLIYDNRHLFYNVFNKKIVKLLNYVYNNMTFGNNINISLYTTFSNNNKNDFLLFLVYMNMFTLCMNIYFSINQFNVEHSKNTNNKITYINNWLVATVKIEYIKNTKIFINKAENMLSIDNWKRLAIEDSNIIFTGIIKDVKLNYKKYLIYFNQSSMNEMQKLMDKNKNEIIDLFNKLLENPVYLLNQNKNKENEKDVNILNNKKLNIDNIIFTASSYYLINLVLNYINDILIFESINENIVNQIYYLLDYYIFSGVNMFIINRTYLEKLFSNININTSTSQEIINNEAKFTELNEQFDSIKNYIHLRKYLVTANNNLNQLFSGKYKDVSVKDQNNQSNQKLSLPRLNSQILINNSNMYSLLIESIILVESIIYTYRYTKKTLLYIVSTLNKSESSEKNSKTLLINNINNKLTMYKNVIKELRLFIYKPLINKLFICEQIFNKITNQCWVVGVDIRENNDSLCYLYSLIDEIIDKNEKLSLLSGGSLSYKSNLRFFYSILDNYIYNLFECLIRIKKLNTDGINLFLNNVQRFQKKIEEYLNNENNNSIDLSENFKIVYSFINSWFYNQNELLKFVEEHQYGYKYIRFIVSNGEGLKKCSPNEKDKILSKINKIYFNKIVEFNKIINNK